MAGSFATDIAPLFTPKDVNCMKSFGVLLDNYQYMSDPTGDDTYPDHANANHVYGHLSGNESPQMPVGEPFWTASAEGKQNLQTLLDWMTAAPTYQP
jgi:hypothetical protein